MAELSLKGRCCYPIFHLLKLHCDYLFSSISCSNTNHGRRHIKKGISLAVVESTGDYRYKRTTKASVVVPNEYLHDINSNTLLQVATISPNLSRLKDAFWFASSQPVFRIRFLKLKQKVNGFIFSWLPYMPCYFKRTEG